MGQPTILNWDDLAASVNGPAARREPVTVEWRERAGGVRFLATRPLTPEEIAAEREELARLNRAFERDNALRKARRASRRVKVRPNTFCACGCWLEHASENCPACKFALLGMAA